LRLLPQRRKGLEADDRKHGLRPPAGKTDEVMQPRRQS